MGAVGTIGTVSNEVRNVVDTYYSYEDAHTKDLYAKRLQYIVDNTEYNPSEALTMYKSLEHWLDGDFGSESVDYDDLHEWGTNIEKLISQMPKYKSDTVYRGIRLDGWQLNSFLDKYSVGKEVKMPSLSSWSTSLGTAQDFATNFNLGGTKSVVFVSNSNNGVDISKFSNHLSEKEILQSSKQKWVVNKVSTKDDITYIYLKEV